MVTLGRAKYTNVRARNFEETRLEGSAENVRACVYFARSSIAIIKIRDYSQSTVYQGYIASNADVLSARHAIHSSPGMRDEPKNVCVGG